MKLSLKYFFNFSFLLELFLFAFTMYLSIGVALNILQKAVTQPAVKAEGLSAWQFIIMFIVATVILLVILKYFKKPWLIQGLFYLAIIEGLLFFSQAFFEWPNFLYVVAFFLLAWAFYRNVFIHNVIIVLAVSAIAVIFGLNFMPSAVILILLFLAIYDFWAVYKTKHMVKMFSGMAKAKVHFSLIIPQSFKSLFKKTKTVSPSIEFMFLGTGDLALPAILVVSSLKISQLTALLTALGAVCGFIFLYILFITQEKRAPMPGLPPIILGTLVGFLAYFLII
jgi:presenilin-like A22 family membrane protease